MVFNSCSPLHELLIEFLRCCWFSIPSLLLVFSLFAAADSVLFAELLLLLNSSCWSADLFCCYRSAVARCCCTFCRCCLLLVLPLYLNTQIGLQYNVPPALLVRFLREHRSEWADYGVDVYSAASLKASPYAVPCTKLGGFPSSQVILPLAQTIEHEELLEVVRLEGQAFSPEDIALSRDMYLLQLCSGIDETNSGACAQLVFAPIDESFGDDATMLPSGFRVIPLVPKSDACGYMELLFGRYAVRKR